MVLYFIYFKLKRCHLKINKYNTIIKLCFDLPKLIPYLSFATAWNGTLDPEGHSPVWDCLVCVKMKAVGCFETSG